MKVIQAALVFLFLSALGEVESRIVGGEEVDPGAYPYFTISKNFHEDYACGGSLIHEDVIMTAAHCAGAFADGVKIGVETKDQVGIVRQVVKEIAHPCYDDDTAENDIMLLMLDQPVLNVQPVLWERPANALSTPGETLTVMGFGHTSFEGSLSDTLLQVDVEVMTDDVCSSQSDNLDVMFCAGVSGGGKDSCQGDSGGPIIEQGGTQVGIVSWGIGCGNAANPGFYVRVSAFSDWIEQQICLNSSNPGSDFCSDDPEPQCTGGDSCDRASSLFLFGGKDNSC